jgi:hypothetical protein
MRFLSAWLSGGLLALSGLAGPAAAQEPPGTEAAPGTGEAATGGEAPTAGTPTAETPTAEAQGSEAGRETSTVEAARQHMEQGQALYAQGDFPGAAAEFLAAYQNYQSAAFLFNVGLCYMQANDGLRAVEYFEQYIQADPSAPDRAEIEQRIAEIRGSLAAAPPPEGNEPPPTVVITRRTAQESQREMKSLVEVHTVPEGAHVVITDAAGGFVADTLAPTAETLSEGVYTLKVEHPDYRTIERPLEVSAGRVYVFHVEMSQGEFLGFLRVVSAVAGTQIFVDQHEVGAARQTPWEGVLPVGDHRVWAALPGYETLETSVTVEMGRPTEVTLDLIRVAFGELLVETNVDGASVSVDGMPAGSARAGPDFDRGTFGVVKTIPAGRHAVLIQAEGMKDWAGDVEITRGQRRLVLVRLNPSPSRVSAWVSWGIAAACYVAGGVFGWYSLEIHDGLQSDRDRGIQDGNDPRIFEGMLWSIGADSAFVVGAVMTGLGLYYMLRDPLPESEAREEEPVDFAAIDGWEPAEAESPAVEVSPTAGPGPMGLGLEVRF